MLDTTVVTTKSIKVKRRYMNIFNKQRSNMSVIQAPNMPLTQAARDIGESHNDVNKQNYNSIQPLMKKVSNSLSDSLPERIRPMTSKRTNKKVKMQFRLSHTSPVKRIPLADGLASELK